MQRRPSLCEEDVIKKVRKQGVIVERYELSEVRSAVIGTVRVANRAFEKRVKVSYTFNGWNSFLNNNLIWEGSVGKLGETDKFGMVIPFPSGWSGSVEFFISCEVSGQTFMDNNGGNNYEIDVPGDSQSASPPDKSPLPSPKALCEEDIIKKVRKHKVVVEEYGFTEEKNAVTGTVRVANLAFQKKVQVCYTFNSWNNHFDLNLVWEGSVGALGDTDKFILVIPVPGEWTGYVEFAIRYKVNGQIFWDNNGSKNYMVDVSHCKDKTLNHN